MPFDVAALKGNSATIRCKKPDGQPEPEITWFYQKSEGSRQEQVRDSRKKVNKNTRVKVDLS